jgi:hypothetical protein
MTLEYSLEGVTMPIGFRKRKKIAPGAVPEPVQARRQRKRRAVRREHEHER